MTHRGHHSRCDSVDNWFDMPPTDPALNLIMQNVVSEFHPYSGQQLIFIELNVSIPFVGRKVKDSHRRECRGRKASYLPRDACTCQLAASSSGWKPRKNETFKPASPASSPLRASTMSSPPLNLRQDPNLTPFIRRVQLRSNEVEFSIRRPVHDRSLHTSPCVFAPC